MSSLRSGMWSGTWLPCRSAAAGPLAHCLSCRRTWLMPTRRAGSRPAWLTASTLPASKATSACLA
eukprot:11214397-Lingulodinium_polyedra.AAC.1